MTEYQKHHKFMYHKIKYTKLPSPLFQKLDNTNIVIDLQIYMEYGWGSRPFQDNLQIA